MNAAKKFSVALLTGAGLISAILCVFLAKYGSPILLPGALFGGVSVLYFIFVEGLGSPSRLIAFLGACSLSYPLSVLGALGSGLLFMRVTGFPIEFDNNFNIPLIYMFMGGSIGAAVVLLSGFTLFGISPMKPRVFGAALLYAVVAGMLGALGAEMNRVLGDPYDKTLTGEYIAWQPGLALMLGLLLRQFGDIAAPSVGQAALLTNDEPPRRIGLAAGSLLACVFAGLMFFVWIYCADIFRDHNRAVMLRELKNEEPPRLGLERPEPSVDEQPFILDAIGGLRPLYPQTRTGTTWRTSTPTLLVAGSIGYGLEQAHSMPALRRKAYVQVLRLPNVEWARYEAHYIETHEKIDCERCISRVTKFGTQITQILVQESDVAYLWSSGNMVISVTKEEMWPAGQIPPEITAGQDEVLRLYLEKYPKDSDSHWQND